VRSILLEDDANIRKTGQASNRKSVRAFGIERAVMAFPSRWRNYRLACRIRQHKVAAQLGCQPYFQQQDNILADEGKRKLYGPTVLRRGN